MAGTTVIADDLTGAADCGIAYCLAGLSTFVSLGTAAPPADVEVVSVDTDTRHEAAEIAAERTFTAAAHAYRSGSRSIYKKIDSTLRGNVGVEVAATHRAAALHTKGAPIVIAAPAFPGTGRTMRDGRVLVKGVPLDQTDTWRGSGMAGPADLASILAGAGLSVDRVGLDVVRRGPDALRAHLQDLLGSGVNAVVCDTDEEQDLRMIAEGGARLSEPVVWCGSGGLARHHAAANARPAKRPLKLPDRTGSVMVLVGSRSDLAREQARLLASRRGLETITVAPETLLAREGPPWAAAAGAVRGAIAAGPDVLLVSGLEHLLDLGSGLALAAGLAQLALANVSSLRGVVATGGDVARAVMLALGAGGLHLVGEVEPGVPIGVTGTEPPLALVTKAGAFGDPGTLERCRNALRDTVGD